jgi:hypothetical protein
MEIDKAQDVMQETNPAVTCITMHSGVQPVCLDRHVLQVAYYQYRQQYGERQEQSNE